MNNSIKTILVLTLVTFTAFVQSCKKPKYPPVDPCVNPYTVTAIDTGMYIYGQFTLTDKQNNTFYLNAINWNEYAHKVVPGRQYKIGYVETECKDDVFAFTYNIAKGGCFLPPRKCIILKCLMEVKQTGCRESIINPPNFNEESSGAVSSSGIVGNSLYAKVGFSGCSGDDGNYFKLHLSWIPERCGTPPRQNDVFLAKAVNNYDGVTCMAYFEKDVCFDLSAVKNYYMARNSQMPKSVIIRLMVGEQSKDFIYSLY